MLLSRVRVSLLKKYQNPLILTGTSFSVAIVWSWIIQNWRSTLRTHGNWEYYLIEVVGITAFSVFIASIVKDLFKKDISCTKLIIVYSVVAIIVLHLLVVFDPTYATK